MRADPRRFPVFVLVASAVVLGAGPVGMASDRKPSVRRHTIQAIETPPAVNAERANTVSHESTGPSAADAAKTKMTAPGPPIRQRVTAAVSAPASSARQSSIDAGDAPA